MQAGVATFPERRIRRQRQQQRQVSQHAVADHDRFVARIDADVDMQSEGDESAGHVLHQIDEFVIAIVDGDFLIPPRRERVRGRPEQFQSQLVGGGGQVLQFARQILAHVSDRATDVGVDFEVTLHQFRFDRFRRFLRELS